MSRIMLTVPMDHVRTGTRFEHYDALRVAAIDETKKGGDPMKAVAFAILASAEATLQTEFDGTVHIPESISIVQ